MAKPKKEEPASGSPAWMGTYSDLVTLLFCFFVLLYAMSSIDEAKFQSLANSFAGKPVSVVDFGGGEGISEMLGSGITQIPDPGKGKVDDAVKEIQAAQDKMEEMADEWKTYFADELKRPDIEVLLMNQEIKVTFPDGMLFDSGSAALKEDALAVLGIIGVEFNNYPTATMRVEGHTDNRPIHTVQYPSNWQLSSDRAISVITHFIDTMRLDATRFMATGYADTRPVDANGTPEGRARNRRVEVYIMSEFYADADQVNVQ
jgi:chemotaxis protein MotB